MDLRFLRSCENNKMTDYTEPERQKQLEYDKKRWKNLKKKARR